MTEVVREQKPTVLQQAGGMPGLIEPQWPLLSSLVHDRNDPDLDPHFRRAEGRHSGLGP